MTLPIPCPICAGEGEVPIYSATDGSQTDYTARCPRCLGFGTVGAESAAEHPGTVGARLREGAL